MPDKVISVPSITAVVIPLLVLVCTVFGPGLLNVPPAPYLAIALSLGYLDRLGPWSRSAVIPNLYLFACITVGTGIAYAGMLQADDWDNSLMAAPFLIGLGVAFVGMIPLWIHLAWQRRFLPQDRFQNGPWALLATLVAPSVWVAIFTIVYAVSPIGSYGSIAYTQFQLEPIVQWSSVAGIAGIEFLVVSENIKGCHVHWTRTIHANCVCISYIHISRYGPQLSSIDPGFVMSALRRLEKRISRLGASLVLKRTAQQGFSVAWHSLQHQRSSLLHFSYTSMAQCGSGTVQAHST